MMNQVLTSVQNPRVKQVVALQQKSAERRRCGLFVVEGRRELGHCLAAGYEVTEVYVCRDILTDADALLGSLQGVATYEVTPYVYDKLAYRGGTEGVVALVKSRPMGLDDLRMGERPLLMVLESVEKPGNLGAVLDAGANVIVAGSSMFRGDIGKNVKDFTAEAGKHPVGGK